MAHLLSFQFFCLVAFYGRLVQAESCSEDGTCASGLTEGDVLLQNKKTATEKEAVEELEQEEEESSGEDCFSTMRCYQDVKFPVDASVGWTMEWGNEQKADIMVPTAPAPPNGWPGLVLVHGLNMNENSMYFQAKRLIKKMLMVTMCTEYGYGKKRHPDAEGAVRYLVAQANTYSVNPSKVFVYGYSLGATIVEDLLVGGKDSDKSAWMLANVKAAVIVSGSYQIHANKVKGGGFSGIMPALFVHCTNDWTMAYKNSKTLVQELQRKNQDVALKTCNTGHSANKNKEWFDGEVSGFLNFHANSG